MVFNGSKKLKIPTNLKLTILGKLQSDPCKRRQSSAALSFIEITKIINLLTWRGEESAACLAHFYRIESNKDDSLTSRVEYDLEFSKTWQGGSRKCSESNVLTENNQSNVCPARLFQRLMSKMESNIKTNILLFKSSLEIRKWSLVW